MTANNVSFSTISALITSGVPQGSILGPLLFLVYVNDISTNMSSETRLFADDCTLFRNVLCKQDCISLQNDLTKIFSWSQKWQLSLNISKCKVLCISNKRSPPSYTYMMNISQLEFVDDFKYLGVHIDSHLKWNDHPSFASHKATRVLNLLRRSMYMCRRSAKERAFTALVRPHLELHCTCLESLYHHWESCLGEGSEESSSLDLFQVGQTELLLDKDIRPSPN